MIYPTTKDITPTQYAKIYGCQLDNVTKMIRNNKQLPNVIKITKFSRFYLLTIPATITKSNFWKAYATTLQ